MRSRVFVQAVIGLVWAVTTPAVRAVEPAGVSLQEAPRPSGLRQVNITSDSATGWLPSEELEREAYVTARRYFAAVDAGEYDQAYAMLGDGLKRLLPFDQFATSARKFAIQGGSLKDRRALKLTWTKDPSNAPQPGIYAALDVASRFVGVDRHCGYLILYKGSLAEKFHIVREENNMINNVTAAKIERDKSRAELDRLWASLASNCPNYQ